MTDEQVLLASFAAIEGAHFYSSFLPSVMTIRKFASDPEAVHALREGELLATGFAMALGVIIGMLIKSPIPVLFAGGMSVAMLSIYEMAISGGFRLPGSMDVSS